MKVEACGRLYRMAIISNHFDCPPPFPSPSCHPHSLPSPPPGNVPSSSYPCFPSTSPFANLRLPSFRPLPPSLSYLPFAFCFLFFYSLYFFLVDIHLPRFIFVFLFVLLLLPVFPPVSSLLFFLFLLCHISPPSFHIPNLLFASLPIILPTFPFIIPPLLGLPFSSFLLHSFLPLFSSQLLPSLQLLSFLLLASFLHFPTFLHPYTAYSSQLLPVPFLTLINLN